MLELNQPCTGSVLDPKLPGLRGDLSLGAVSPTDREAAVTSAVSYKGRVDLYKYAVGLDCGCNTLVPLALGT